MLCDVLLQNLIHTSVVKWCSAATGLLLTLLHLSVRAKVAEVQHEKLTPNIYLKTFVVNSNAVTDGGNPGEYSGCNIIVKPTEVHEIHEVTSPILLDHRQGRPQYHPEQPPLAAHQQLPLLSAFRNPAVRLAKNYVDTRNFQKPPLNIEISPAAASALATAFLQNQLEAKRSRKFETTRTNQNCMDMVVDVDVLVDSNAADAVVVDFLKKQVDVAIAIIAASVKIVEDVADVHNGGCGSTGAQHQNHKCPLSGLLNGGDSKTVNRETNCCCDGCGKGGASGKCCHGCENCGCNDCCCEHEGGQRTPPKNYKLKFMQNTQMEVALGNNGFGGNSKPVFNNALNSVFKFTKNLVRPIRRTINQLSDTANKSVRRMFLIEKLQTPTMHENQFGISANNNHLRSALLNEDSTPPTTICLSKVRRIAK
uniref:Uncharacterized protein n=1 Tax=Syphacia muris TaxID=451379 RepID=A0A0N5AMF5_9BILA